MGDCVHVHGVLLVGSREGGDEVRLSCELSRQAVLFLSSRVKSTVLVPRSEVEFWSSPFFPSQKFSHHWRVGLMGSSDSGYCNQNSWPSQNCSKFMPNPHLV